MRVDAGGNMNGMNASLRVECIARLPKVLYMIV